MKKLITVLWVLLSYTVYSQVQGLTQSAEGKSTIPIRGAAIGIDIAETELSFGYNNINRVVQSKSVKGIFGLEVRIKNEEGIGNLFNAGDIVPSGKANLYGGFTFSNAFNTGEEQNLVKRNSIIEDYKIKQKNLRAKLAKYYDYYISLAVEQITDDVQRDLIKRDLIAELKNVAKKEEEYYNSIKGKKDPNSTIQTVYNDVIGIAQKGAEEFETQKIAHIARLKGLHVQFTNTNFQRFTIFGFGGISAIGFKQFKGIDSSNFSNSFDDIDERGDNIGIGINYQWRNIWLGLTYSRVDGNNFPFLKKKEYTQRNTITNNSQALIEETKVKGYSGIFGEVKYSDLNADVILRIRLDEEYKNYLLVNPYIRASIKSADTSLLLNKTNIGTGLYFLQNNSKFLGGIYFELPDVNNNAEKRKLVDKQNLRPPLRRLTFGVVTNLI